jgi:hypothetical protein
METIPSSMLSCKVEVVDRSIDHPNRIVLIIGASTESIMQRRIGPTFVDEEAMGDSMCTGKKKKKVQFACTCQTEVECVMLSNLYMKTGA